MWLFFSRCFKLIFPCQKFTVGKSTLWHLLKMQTGMRTFCRFMAVSSQVEHCTLLIHVTAFCRTLIFENSLRINHLTSICVTLLLRIDPFQGDWILRLVNLGNLLSSLVWVFYKIYIAALKIDSKWSGIDLAFSQ